MEEQKNNGNTTIHNHFAEGSNCQVFNAPISNAIFAMPGSHVTQVAAKADEQTKSEENDLVSLSPELQTGKARRLWDAARDAGWVDDNCQPLLSRALSAVLADRMATLLNIQNKWKVFESFWGMKGLRSAYNNALNQKQFDEFYEKLKNNIR